MKLRVHVELDSGGSITLEGRALTMPEVHEVLGWLREASMAAATMAPEVELAEDGQGA